MVPPLASDLICSGPVTRAATSSRLSSSAWLALNDRLSSVLPPEKVTEPLPADRAAAGRLAGDLAEDQLRAGEARLGREMVDDHAGDLAFEPAVLRLAASRG